MTEWRLWGRWMFFSLWRWWQFKAFRGTSTVGTVSTLCWKERVFTLDALSSHGRFWCRGACGLVCLQHCAGVGHWLHSTGRWVVYYQRAKAYCTLESYLHFVQRIGQSWVQKESKSSPPRTPFEAISWFPTLSDLPGTSHEYSCCLFYPHHGSSRGVL